MKEKEDELIIFNIKFEEQKLSYEQFSVMFEELRL